MDLPSRESLLDIEWLERQHAQHGAEGLERCLRRGAERYGGAVSAVTDALVSYDARSPGRLGDKTDLRHFLTHRLYGGSWSPALDGPCGYKRKAGRGYIWAVAEPSLRDELLAFLTAKGHPVAPVPALPQLSDLQLLPSVEAVWVAHAQGIWGCDVSPDCRHLVSASEDRSLAVWDMAAATLVSRLTTDHGEVRDCLFTHDGTRIVSVHADGRVMVWSMETMHPVFTTDTPLPTRPRWGRTHRWRRAAMSPDSGLLAIADWHGGVDVWDLNSGTRAMTLDTQLTDGQSIGVFLPSGKVCVTVGCGQRITVVIWDLDAQLPSDRITIDISGRQPTTVVLTPDTRHLIASSASSRLVDTRTTAWALPSGEVTADVPGDIAGRALALSADGSLLATATSRSSVHLRTLPTLTETARWYLPDLGCRDLATALAFARDNTALIVGGWDGVLRRIPLPAKHLNVDVVLSLLAGYSRGLLATIDNG
jgi:WD40 repeat protein